MRNAGRRFNLRPTLYLNQHHKALKGRYRRKGVQPFSIGISSFILIFLIIILKPGTPASVFYNLIDLLLWSFRKCGGDYNCAGQANVII
jgi:hypothetical protein